MNARQLIEAEDPKSFLKREVPVAYEITWEDTAGQRHIARLKEASPEDAEELLYFGYANVAKVIEIKPMSRAAYAQYMGQWHQEAEDPKSFLKKHAPAPEFEVVGTKKSWLVDRRGDVTTVIGSGRPHPEKFNVDEYRERTGNYPSGHVKLQQISYWDFQGNYFTCGPELRGFTRIPRQEAEDPKEFIQQHAIRPTPFTITDVALEERREAEEEYRWTAMWATPFLIANRRKIRGCPAGTGRNSYVAIRELLERTNKESKTKFYFQFPGGYSAPQQEAK